MRLGERKLTRDDLHKLAEEYCSSYPVGASMFFAPGPERDTIEYDIQRLGHRLAKAAQVPYRILFGHDEWDEPVSPARESVDDRINRRDDKYRFWRIPRPHCNRHDRERWLRKFREVASVAHDALLGGERGRAIGVLTELLQLEDAVRLCSRPKRIFDYVDIKIERSTVTYPADDAANTLDLRRAQIGALTAEELAAYPQGSRYDVVDAIAQSVRDALLGPAQPYTDDGIPLVRDALQRAVGDLEEQRRADSTALDTWAAVAGVARFDDEGDEQLRERIRARMTREKAQPLFDS